MNFIPCLTWVSKGIAKSCPDKLQLSPEELKMLIEDTRQSVNDNEIDEEEESEISGSEEENESATHIKEEPTNDNSEDDFDAKYDLDGYDDEDEERPFMKITDVATFVDNEEDQYITDYTAVDEDEKEDDEDFLIKDSDNLLITGHVEEESSVLEVHIYNKEEGTFYIHHDIVLPAYPLALEWLDFHPSDETPGNYIAVGDMTPLIKIWDLDVVEILEPDYCLGEKTKKKAGEKLKLKHHKDAVISLSWNKHLRNILASGSADSSIIIWDLQEGTALNKLKFHSNKVQSLQWHPFESSFLLSSCTDGFIKLFDCRAPDAECKSWSVEGEIEKVTWNLFDSLKFFCSTDTGFVHSFDMRKTEVEHSTKAHDDGVTALDMCPQQPNILLTASMDKYIKLWNIENGFSLINSQKLKVGSIYTAKFAPDSELPVAVGGNNPSTSLKIIDVADIVGIKKETEEASSELKLETNSSTDNVKVENTKPPKKMKFSKAGPSQKFHQVALSKKNSQESQNSNTDNIKAENTKPPKKMKFSKAGPSQKLNQVILPKKNSQESQQVVKRIHKKY